MKKTLIVLGSILLVVVLLAMCGAVVEAGKGDKAAKSVPTAASVNAQPAPAPVPDPTTEAAPFAVKVTDFTIAIKITKKQCFGSAGCNVEYRINPTYVGSQPLPSVGTIEVTYQVSGDESGPLINTFSIINGTMTFDSSESASTSSSGTKLKAKVTDVFYDPTAS